MLAITDEQIAAADAKEIVPRPKRDSAQERLKQRSKEGVVSVSRGLGHSFTRVGNLARLFFGGESTSGARRRNTALIALAVFAIPTVLVVTVMLSWVGNVGETVYEECVGRATEGAVLARVLQSQQADNRNSVLASWTTTLTIIDECQNYRPDFIDVNLNTIRDEAQLAVDRMSGITRRRATALWVSQDEGANIRELVLQGVDSIYAFDNNNSVVYRLQLNETGDTVISAQPIQQMSFGARVEGNTLGRIIGIAYDQQRDLISTLDENGVLVSCRPLVINTGCDSQQLVGFEVITNPTRFVFWTNRLYVLDIGSQQIWRFDPVGNTDNYANRPTEYYQGAVRPPNLDQAVDFAIGSPTSNINGNVYTLYNDGTMTRHFSGNNEGFVFRGLPLGLETPDQTTTQAMYLNDSNLFTGFYVVSRPLRTIYYFTTAGTFQNAYRIQDESLFERINDVAADPEQNTVYVASGNGILAFNANE